MMMRKMGNQSRVRDFRHVGILLLFSRHFFSISSSLVVQISMILLLYATFIAFVLLGASILEELSLLSFLKDVQAKNLRSTHE
tara:strand:- start:168 stop:416 length:249 start_codon:yes stop_codon:yes gene_type:complete